MKPPFARALLFLQNATPFHDKRVVAFKGRCQAAVKAIYLHEKSKTRISYKNAMQKFFFNTNSL